MRQTDSTFRRGCHSGILGPNQSRGPGVSQLLIQQYLNELQTLRRVSGTTRESVVSEAFKTLLKDWGKSCDLIFITRPCLRKTRIYPDGALLYGLRVPFGYWEAKDEEDDLDKEIEKKFRKGYPQDNIIFEDSRDAVLIQNKEQVMRCGALALSRPSVLPSTICTVSAPRIGNFRGSMAGLRAPLSTLRRGPHGQPRMTRGRCGSLLLHRKGLAPSTPCRSPGASHMFSGVPQIAAGSEPWHHLR
jgi:hypothetical protein